MLDGQYGRIIIDIGQVHRNRSGLIVVCKSVTGLYRQRVAFRARFIVNCSSTCIGQADLARGRVDTEQWLTAVIGRHIEQAEGHRIAIGIFRRGFRATYLTR